MQSFLWFIVIAMAIMSMVLLMGTGAGLIAGYNTSSAEEKLKYDEKKLCRTMGAGLSVLTVLVAVMLFFNFKFSNKVIEYILIAIMTIDVLAMFILKNTVCRRK